MTRSGFEYIRATHVAVASRSLPSTAAKGLTPHVLRHSCAMHMLRGTRDIRKVTLWLGHASLQSTEAYLRADPPGKLEALAAGTVPTLRSSKFRPPDKAHRHAEAASPFVILCRVMPTVVRGSTHAPPRTPHNPARRITPHVGLPQGQPHAHTGGERDHRRSSASSTRRSDEAFTSQPIRTR